MYNWKKKKRLRDFYKLHWTQRVFTSRTAQPRHVTLFGVGESDGFCSQCGVSFWPEPLRNLLPLVRHSWTSLRRRLGGKVACLSARRLLRCGAEAKLFAPKCIKWSEGERLLPLQPPHNAQCMLMGLGGHPRGEWLCCHLKGQSAGNVLDWMVIVPCLLTFNLLSPKLMWYFGQGLICRVDFLLSSRKDKVMFQPRTVFINLQSLCFLQVWTSAPWLVM